MNRRSFGSAAAVFFAAAILCASVSILSPARVEGAGFDCKKSRTFIERAICGDRRLSALDDRLNGEYGKALAASFAPDELKGEQREWLASVRNACQDAACLKRVYAQRIEWLSAYDERQRKSRESEVCEFKGLALPESFAVFAAGGYTGRRIDFQIDQSGHQATQMDVTVNHPSRPVVLLLGAYEPTIWNIRWTPATRIAAALVSGYHRQAVAGLDPAVPVLNSSYDNKGPCGYFYVGENDLGKLNPMARRFFGRPVDSVYLARNGIVLVGDPVPEGVKTIASDAVPPESFYDRTAPLAGPAGLEDAVRKGILRKATSADADAWVEAADANDPGRDVPPVAGRGRPRPPRPHTYNAYVVLGPFTFPAGLYGGNSATFFVPRGVPRPTGNPGHSNVYDFNKFRIDAGPGPALGKPPVPEASYGTGSRKTHRRGKYYFEVTIDHANVRQGLEAEILVGVKGGGRFLAATHRIGPRDVVIQTGEGGSITIVGAASGGAGLSGTVIGVAVDLDSRRIYRHTNGDWGGKIPADDNGTALPAGDAFHAEVQSSVPIERLVEEKILAPNFGRQPFAYALPAGYAPFDGDARQGGPAARSSPVSIVGPGAPVAGAPIGTWIQRYWQWTRSFPGGESPSEDLTGERCAAGQSGPVFFLTGSARGAPVSRTCTVPKGKHILVPLLTTLAQVPRTSGRGCGELQAVLRKVNDSAADLSLAIDGSDVASPGSYKSESACFDLWDASRGTSEMAAYAGYWVVLNPPEAGKHEIRFSGRYDADGFRQDVRYHLRVE